MNRYIVFNFASAGPFGGETKKMATKYSTEEIAKVPLILDG